MAYGNWEAVIAEYQRDILIHPTSHFGHELTAHAKMMLDLVPVLRELPEVTNFLPGTSHGTLFLRRPGYSKSLYVWYFGENGFHVYFYPDNSEDPMSREVVERDRLISEVQRRLQILSLDSETEMGRTH